jgi:antitoxin component of MazEF toxin-antitoxin module
MKVIRRLTRRGHSSHVSIPPQMMEYLRWRITDGVVVEVTDDDEIRIRRVRPSDLGSTSMPPMNLELPALGVK